MTVGELRALLAGLPEDMPVRIQNTDRPAHCAHVTKIEKLRKNRHMPKPEAFVRLTGAVNWTWDDPGFEIEGHFPDVDIEPPTKKRVVSVRPGDEITLRIDR